MAIQDHPNKNRNDNAQPNKMRPAPKLQRAQSKAGEQEIFPEKLQYTGKNLRVDYLQSREAASVTETVAKDAVKAAAEKRDDSKREEAIAKARAQAQLSRQSSVQRPSVQKPASPTEPGQKAAAKKPLPQPAPSQRPLPQKDEVQNVTARKTAAPTTAARKEIEKKATDDKKRQRRMLIAAAVLIAAILLIFGISSLLNRDPKPDPDISVDPTASVPAGAEAWTKAELEAAKLALSKEVIFPGIFIAGIDMSGLSAQEASDILAEEAERLRDEIKITVRANN